MAVSSNGHDDHLSPVQGEVKELAKLVAEFDELEALAVAYLIWKQQELTGSPSLRRIADALDVGKDTVYGRLQRFQKTYGHFLLKNTDLLEVKQVEVADQIFHMVRDLLDRFEDIRTLRLDRPESAPGRPLTIVLGAGQGLCNSWVRQVVRPFMEKYRNQPALMEKYRNQPARVVINLVSKMPQQLREEGAKGHLDLYVTSWPKDDPKTDEVVEEIFLKFQLICPYGHPALELPEAKSLRDTTVIVLARHEDRVPRAKYPIAKLEEAGARVEEVLTYEEAYSRMRLGDSRIACFGLSEILSDEDKREFVGVPLLDVGLETREEPMEEVRICLVTPERARRRRGTELNKLVNELAGAFKLFLKTVVDEIRLDLLNQFNNPDNPWRLYHVRRLGNPGQPFWSGGKLQWRFSRDGSVRGIHTVGLREIQGGNRDEQKFRIYGKLMVSTNPASKLDCHLAWQGVFEVIDDPSAQRTPETYDASFVFSRDKVVDDNEVNLERRQPLVGVWQGRRTYPSDDGGDSYLPDWGYMVLCRKDLPRNRQSARWLSEQVCKYQHECGIGASNMDMLVPKDWEDDLPTD
jgi:DNA-binding transcriptional LysR family regulator